MTTLCNFCGYSCTLGPLPGVPEGRRTEKEIISFDEGGLLNAKVSGGYNSTPGNGEGALDDMSSYEFSLCEFCLDWLFSSFTIPPVVRRYHEDHPCLFRPAAQRVAEDEWRKAKEAFYAEAKWRASARARNRKDQ